MEEENFSKQITIHLMAGSMAAIFVDTISFPLDTIRTRLQVTKNNLKHTVPKNNLFKGFLPQIIISAPAGGAYFFGYECTKKLDGQFFKKDNKTNQAFFGGIGAEFCGVLVRNPFEIMKQQMQVGNGTMLEVMNKLYNQNGFLTFYRGFVSMLLREIPFSVVQMPIYETIKQYYLRKGNKDFMDTKESCIAALFAGGTAGIVTNPIDVVKTNIMTTQKQYNQNIKTWDNGIEVFMRGLYIRAFYASYISVFFFLGYEKMREYFYNKMKIKSDLFELSDKDKDNLYIFNLIDNEIDKQEIRDNYRNSLKIVGGFTRDKILKKQYNDIDAIIRYNIFDIICGLIECQKEKLNIEDVKFLILKTEGIKGSHLIKFRYNNYDFEIKSYQTLNEDYQSRDFTINALYYQYFQDSVLDCGTSFYDIKYKNLNLTNNFTETFQESFTRFIRLAKFMSQGYIINKDTLVQVQQYFSDNKFKNNPYYSSKTWQYQMKRILLNKNSANIIEQFYKLGLFRFLQHLEKQDIEDKEISSFLYYFDLIKLLKKLDAFFQQDQNIKIIKNKLQIDNDQDLSDIIYFLKSNAFIYSYFRPEFNNIMHFTKGFFRIKITHQISEELTKKLHELKDPMQFEKLLKFLQVYYDKEQNTPRVIQILPYLDNENYENILQNNIEIGNILQQKDILSRLQIILYNLEFKQ